MLKAILARHVPEADVWVFGSRATGRSRRHSDLDLAIGSRVALPLGVLGALRDDLSESDLPMMVDVLDLNTISPEFRKIVEQEQVPLP